MHPCLCIPEILSMVAAFVKAIPDPYEDFNANADALLSLALTCRAFHEPALAMLWSELNGIYPLLRFFPEDVWYKHEDVGEPDGDRKKPRRSVTCAHWNRFLAHSKFVRRIAIFHLGSEEKMLDILRWLNTYRPTADLFPGLRELEWYHGDIDHAKFSDLFVGPQLGLASVHGVTDEGSAVFVQSLVKNCHALRTLEITTTDDEGPPAIKTAAVLHKCGHVFTALTSLHCRQVPLSDTFIIHLSGLPNLKTLCCGVVSLDSNFTTFFRKDQQPFPALCTLSLCTETLSLSVVSLLQACKAPQMERFDLWLRDQPPTAHLRTLFEALGTHHALHSVAVYVRLPRLSDTASDLITQTVLQPLFTCPMRHLTLSTISSGLDDNSMAALGDAWPGLETLHVGHSLPVRSSRVTPAGLHALAKRCPRIGSIGTHLDTSSVAEEQLRAPPVQKCRALQNLAVGYPSPSRNPLLAVAILSGMFPCATLWGEGWRELNPEMKMFQAARAQEQLAPLE